MENPLVSAFDAIRREDEHGMALPEDQKRLIFRSMLATFNIRLADLLRLVSEMDLHQIPNVARQR